MENELEQPEPKISLPEAFLIGFPLLLVDALQVVLGFFALDDFWILDLFTGTIFIYLAIRGIPLSRQLIGWIIELFPYVGAFLPANTLGWCLTVWADHHPESLVGKAAVAAAAFTPKGGAAQKAMARMERQEATARRYLHVPDRTRSPDAAAASQSSVAEPKGPTPSQELARETYEAQSPYKEMQKVFEEPPPHKVLVDQDGTVDLRNAA